MRPSSDISHGLSWWLPLSLYHMNMCIDITFTVTIIMMIIMVIMVIMVIMIIIIMIIILTIFAVPLNLLRSSGNLKEGCAENTNCDWLLELVAN